MTVVVMVFVGVGGESPSPRSAAAKRHVPTVFEGKSAEYWAQQIADDLGSQRNAKLALVALGHHSVPFLCRLLGHDDFRVRNSAWEVLDQIEQRDGVAAVRGALPCAVEALKTGEGIAFVSSFGAEAESAIPLILATRTMPHHGFPGGALVAIGTASAVAAVVPFLADEDSETRGEAAKALKAFGLKARAATPELVVLLRSPSSHDCEASAEALAAIGVPKNLVADLLDRLKRPQAAHEGVNEYNYCRGATLRALAAAGQGAVSALPELEQLLTDGSVGDLAATTMSALGATATPSLPRVVELVWTPEGASRQYLFGILRSIGRAAIPDLQKLAADPSPELSRSAKEALASIRLDSRVVGGKPPRTSPQAGPGR